MGSLAQEFPQVLLQVLHGDWGMAPAAQPPGTYVHHLGRRHLQKDGVGGMFLSTPIRPGFQFSPQLLTTCL